MDFFKNGSKIFLTILFFALFITHFAFAADPATLQNQAKSNIVTANRLYVKASDIVKNDPSRDGMRSAVAILIEAGKLFEEAGNIYKNLVPNYASEQDVKNSYNAMQQCVDAVQSLQSQIDLNR